MVYRLLADVVVTAHLFFIAFAVLGSGLVLWKRSVAWVHIPAVLWAAGIAFSGWICPLTPLENLLRQKGGMQGYESGFIENYIMPVVYPPGLTRSVQIFLGAGVLVLNLMVYMLALRHSGKKRARK